MKLNFIRTIPALRTITVTLVFLSFFQLPALTATATAPLSAAMQSSGTDPLVFFLGGIPLGFVRGETIRISVSSPDQAQSQAPPDGRKFKMLVAPLILDAQGHVIAQKDEILIEQGQFHSFDFHRDDLPLAGEPGTGRLQVRTQIRYRFLSILDRTQMIPDDFPATIELIDETGRTAVLQPHAFQIISAGQD
jgi:hypothetical protein